MQNRTFSEYCPSTHLVSRCAYSLSGAAFNETGKSVQRRKNPVGLSPSSVQPEFRDGQILLIGREISRGGMLQVSQGGKQESLYEATPQWQCAMYARRKLNVLFTKSTQIQSLDSCSEHRAL